MKLPNWIKISAPTKKQMQHDLYLIVSAFVAAAIATWQVQPDKFGKAAAVAGVTAGIAAVVSVVKSIATTL